MVNLILFKMDANSVQRGQICLKNPCFCVVNPLKPHPLKCPPIKRTRVLFCLHYRMTETLPICRSDSDSTT